MLRSRMWATNSLSLLHSRPLVLSSLTFFFRLYNLISATWSTLSTSLRFYFFIFLFFFLCVSWLEYFGIYYFRLLSLFPNFISCSSFLGSYLDPASSTLLAPLAYALFSLRLRSWSCYPRSFAFFELREVSPLLVFLSLLIFIISPHRSCSFNTVFLHTLRFFLSPYFTIFILDIYYLIMSSLFCLSLSLSLSYNVHPFVLFFFLHSLP